MAKSSDLEKTWKPGPATQQTFNAPGNLSVPYGRYRGIVSGRGASGNAPNAATYNTNYNTNYNVAYPVGNQPIGSQPAASWNTNYNVSYPVWYYAPGNPYIAGYNPSNYSLYVVQHIDCESFENTWVANLPGISPGNPSYQSPAEQCLWTAYEFQNHLSRYAYYQAAIGVRNYSPFYPSQTFMGCCSWLVHQYSPSPVQASSNSRQFGGTPGNAYYAQNVIVYYYVDYPVGSQPVSSYNTNYNTNYNVAYPVGNRPIATQPAATYNPATAGTPATIFGVPFPGGNASNTIGSPNPAPSVPETVFPYYSAPDGTSVAVSVPPGGVVNVRLE